MRRKRTMSALLLTLCLLAGASGIPAQAADEAEEQTGALYEAESNNSISVSPSVLEFGAAQENYAAISAQTVTVKNNTAHSMTVEQPSSYNYEIGLLSNTVLDAGASAVFTIRPMTGLMANSYNGKITIRAGGYSADLTVNFIVDAGLPPTGFLDVPADYSFAEDIAYVAQRGLMNGVGNGCFAPWGLVTRGQIVTILYRLAEEPEAAGSGFSDVASGSYCENAVKWASANGIASGYADGSFKPGAPVTREQLAVFLFRFAAAQDLNTAGRGDLSKFSDGESVSSYAREAVSWANAMGLLNGDGENRLDPSGRATRAQAAAVFHRFCEHGAE